MILPQVDIMRLPPRPAQGYIRKRIVKEQNPIEILVLRPSSGYSRPSSPFHRSVSRKSRDSSSSKQDRCSLDYRKQKIIKPPRLRQKFLPKVSAKSWIVFDISNKQIVDGLKVTRRRQVASLTKIMTFYTALKQLERLQLKPARIKVTISSLASKFKGTTANLKQGMQLSLYDLFYGLMLPSGNDAAIAIAQTVGGIIYLDHQKNLNKSYIGSLSNENINQAAMKKGTISLFLIRMNQNARALGLINTCFTNPHGLSQKTNYSSAQDIAKLVTEAMTNDIFKQIVSTQFYTCSYGLEDQPLLSWQNTNKLLAQGFQGVKTGITPNAGPCLASSYKGMCGGNIMHYCFVLISSTSMEHRWQQTKNLLRWAMDRRR